MPAKSLAIIVLFLCSCAPSLRMVHQSNTYFERCHAADVDASVRVDVKQRCWAQWLEHYAVGQTPERLQYAQGRVEALDRGETVAPMPGMPAGTTVDAAYAPTFLPVMTTEDPPSVDSSASHGSDAGPPPAAGVRASPAPPVDDLPCASVCRPRYDACVARCEGRPAACTDSCGIERRTCARACY